MSRRACKGTNRAGEPCGCSPLGGEDWCAVHHPNPPESVRFIPGAQPGAGRPRVPRPTEVAVEQIQARIGEVLAVLWEGLAATKDNGAPDWSARATCARELLDRGLGKPHQSTEITGAGSGPVTIAEVWAGSLNGHAASLN